MGQDTLNIPMELFRENRERLCKRLKDREDVKPGAVVVLQGGEQTQRYCTDTDVVFRQVQCMIFRLRVHVMTLCTCAALPGMGIYNSECKVFKCGSVMMF